MKMNQLLKVCDSKTSVVGSSLQSQLTIFIITGLLTRYLFPCAFMISAIPLKVLGC